MPNQQPVETTLYSLDSSPPKAPKTAQRRNSERHLSLLRVGCLIVGDRRELCLVKNISVGGMQIRVYSQIRPGTRLSVELKQGESVSGIARWVKDDGVGVTFDQPIDVVGLISASTRGRRPRMPRIEVQSAAWVREGATVHRATAVNISQGGLKIVAPTILPVGAAVVVSLTGVGPIAGVIRWAEQDAYGITFNRALGLSMLVAWLQEQQQRQRLSSAG
jgi:hypothetical protein